MAFSFLYEKQTGGHAKEGRAHCYFIGVGC